MHCKGISTTMESTAMKNTPQGINYNTVKDINEKEYMLDNGYIIKGICWMGENVRYICEGVTFVSTCLS